MSGQLETACIDCTRYEPQDGLGHALALLSGTPYLIIFSQALVSLHNNKPCLSHGLRLDFKCLISTELSVTEAQA